MGKQGTRLLRSYKITQGNGTHLDIELYYSKGGMNYFNGVNEKRGLYVSTQPCTKNELGSDMRTVSFIAFSGVKRHVKDMGRYSQSVLDKYVPDEEIIDSLLTYTVAKNNIQIDKTNLVV